MNEVIDMLFEYKFRLHYAEGQDIIISVMADRMASAWFGIGNEVSIMSDQPLSIEWIGLK
jgi:hypothetical protein